MWFLVIILLTPPIGIHKTTTLQTYTTWVECHVESLRITKDMELAYPGDTSYQITCLQSTKGGY